MLSTILSAFTVAEIRKKLLFTAAMLAVYRFGAHITVPGINTSAVESVQEQFGGGGVLNLLNTFSGGGLSRIALFALGIMPYITASIILQLLQVVIPSLEKLKEEGEVGQQLQDDRGRDVRHDPEREQGDAREPAAREQVEEAEDVGPGVVVLELLERLRGDARHRDVGAEPVEREEHCREQQLLADLRNLERVQDGRQHGRALLGRV